MSDKLDLKDDIQGQKLKSENGTEYQAGQFDASPHPADAEPVVPVNWPVDNTWHAASREVQWKTGVTSYMVGSSPGPVYNYYIQFNTNRTGNNGFTDSGNPKDTYWIPVTTTSATHFVRYNPNPNNQSSAAISAVIYTL